TFADALRINRKPDHPMRIHSAQICLQQAVSYFFCTFRSYFQSFEDRATEFVELFRTIPPWFHHAVPPEFHRGRFKISIVDFSVLSCRKISASRSLLAIASRRTCSIDRQSKMTTPSAVPTTMSLE